MADAAASARKTKWLSDHKGKGDFDPRTGVARLHYTSASFAIAAKAKADAKDAERDA